jgi:hypothetical protein
MPDWIFKNKPTAYATLASPSGTSGTTLTLTTGHGTRLPAPGAGQISAVRIENELITYTGNSGDVLTGVTRGAGATNHVAGTEVKNVLVEEWANAVTVLSTDTKAALAGTSGTPQAANPYVTDADARNSNARPPTSHGHVESDTTGLVADLAARVLSTDSRLSDARTPTAHAISHKATGGDVLAGIVGGYAPLDSGLLVPVPNLGTGTPTGSKFLRDDRVWAVPAGGGGGSLTIEELDGTPSVAAATKLILPNGTVSVTGTEATYTPAGGGGGSALLYSTGTRVDVTNTTTETTVLSYSVPGGTLGTDGALRITIQARVVHVITGTVTFRLKYGATTILTIAVPPGVTVSDKSAAIWFLLCATGATNSQRASGRVDMQDANGAIFSRWNQEGVATEDSTAAKTLALTVQWGAASASLDYDQSWAGIEKLA